MSTEQFSGFEEPIETEETALEEAVRIFRIIDGKEAPPSSSPEIHWVDTSEGYGSTDYYPEYSYTS